MGNGNIVGNLGVSVLLISIFIILFIIIIVAGLYVSRKYAMSENIINQFKELKQALTYNPLIRYSMLNCLKLNNTGMVAFVGLATGSLQLGLSVVIVFVMTALPIFYAVIIYRKRKELTKE